MGPQESDLDVLIRTGLKDPIGIALAQNLLDEAQIPYFVMDQTQAAHRDIGAFGGWWTIRVPHDCEERAREILLEVEQTQ